MKQKTLKISNLSSGRTTNLLLTLAFGMALNSAHAASPSIWNGGGSGGNWSDAGNWNGNVPVPGATYDLEFAGVTGLASMNDFAAGSAFRNITFNADAGAFTLTGNSILLSGGITNNSTILQTINLPLQVASPRTISANSGGLSLNGAISGNGGFIFNGAGMVTLGGNCTYTNETYVYNGILNFPAGANMKSSFNDIIGQTSGGSAAMNFTGGTLTNTQASGAYNFCVGHASYGMLNMTDGVIKINTLYVGYQNVAGQGYVLLKGGRFYCGTGSDYVCLGFAGTGVMTVDGGLFSHVGANRAISINNDGESIGVLNLLSGTIDNTGGGISFGLNSKINGLGAGTGVVNLNGGNLLLNRVINTSANAGPTGGTFLNFNGATVTLSASALTSPAPSFSSDFLPQLTAVYVNGAFDKYAGGAVIDTAGQNAIVDAALLAPTGQGVSTISVADGGSGYVGAPFVNISGDGSGAAAIANMVDDGTGNGTLSVASITVCNPGVNYTTADYSFGGTSPVTPATPGAITLAANVSGGLTKNGAGTLMLKGANTFCGNTLVNAGTVAISSASTGGGNFSIADGATLNIVQDQAVSTLIASNVTVGVETGAEIDFLLANGNSSVETLNVGTLNLNGANTLKISGGNFAVGQFPLIKYKTLNGDPSLLTSGAFVPPPGTIATLVHNPANSSFDVKITGVFTALTWSGTNLTSGVAIWDTATTVNWIGTAGTAQFFVPGADVTFDETAAGTTNVDVEGIVQPSTISVNNLSKDYFFGGAGSLAGNLALTKSGNGSLTIANTNTYSGSTKVSGGKLVVSGSMTSSTTNSVTIDNGGLLTIAGPVNTGTGDWTIGDDVGNGILNINTGAVVQMNGTFALGLNVGNNGAINVTGGIVTNSQASLANNFELGFSGYGGFRMSDGTMQANTVYIGTGTGASATGTGVALISGGSFYCGTNADYLLVGGGTGAGVLTVSGGLLNHAAANRTISVNNSGDGTAMLNLLGGTIDNTGGGISYGYNAGTGLGTGIVSLNGGNLFLNRFINKKQSGTTNTGAAFLNFNGATVTLTASTLTSPSVSFSSDFLPEMTAVYVNGAFGSYAGGVVIDTAGQNGIVDAALLAPTGQGVGTVALVNGGSGYVGAPFVTISGDGIGATAIANMVDDGTGNGTLSVASITVCNPGVNYTFASCSLSGPTPTAAASTSDVTLVANTSGGLTKNGAGALTLKGTNTYTGTTLVNAGALVVNGSLDDGSTVHVAGGSLGGNGVVNGLVNVDGALAPNGVLTVNNTLNLASASTTLMNVNAASNTSDMVQGVVQLNYGGTLVISNAAGTLIPGQTFSLFNGAAFTGNFAAIESVPGGVTWNFNPTNGVATVLSVVATTPASIHFTSSAGTLSLAWPSSNLGWYAQSNSVNVADTNFWFDIPNSQLGTNLDISINPAMPNVFYRLRSP